MAEAESKQKKLLAEAEAYQKEQVGKAEATAIESVGKATAEAYKLQVEAMGADNFSNFKVVEAIGDKKVKVIPEILISGNNGDNGPISGLLGMELLNLVRKNKEESQPQPQVLKEQPKK